GSDGMVLVGSAAVPGRSSRAIPSQVRSAGETAVGAEPTTGLFGGIVRLLLRLCRLRLGLGLNVRLGVRFSACAYRPEYNMLRFRLGRLLPVIGQYGQERHAHGRTPAPVIRIGRSPGITAGSYDNGV